MLYLEISAHLHTQEHHLGPHPTDNGGFTSGSYPHWTVNTAQLRMVSEHGKYAVALRGGDPPRWRLAYRYQAAFMGIGLTVRTPQLGTVARFPYLSTVRKVVYTTVGGDTCVSISDSPSLRDKRNMADEESETWFEAECMRGDVLLHYRHVRTTLA